MREKPRTRYMQEQDECFCSASQQKLHRQVFIPCTQGTPSNLKRDAPEMRLGLSCKQQNLIARFRVALSLVIKAGPAWCPTIRIKMILIRM